PRRDWERFLAPQSAFPCHKSRKWWLFFNRCRAPTALLTLCCNRSFRKLRSWQQRPISRLYKGSEGPGHAPFLGKVLGLQILGHLIRIGEFTVIPATSPGQIALFCWLCSAMGSLRPSASALLWKGKIKSKHRIF